MPNPSVADIKPWYTDTLEKLIRGLYFSAKMSLRFSRIPKEHREDYWFGSLVGYASVLLYIGVNPEKVLSKDDIELMKRKQQEEQ